MTVTPIRKRYWVVGGFIGVLLVLLVVVTAEVAHAIRENSVLLTPCRKSIRRD